jgi:hypothetical protein
MKIIYCLTALLVFSCSVFAGKEQAAPAAPYIAPLNPKYQLAVRGYMRALLKDPYSAVYRFDNPRKGVVQDGVFVGHKKHYGWIVPTWINAKNGFGGYTGEQLYIMFFFDGQLADATELASYGRLKSLP